MVGDWITGAEVMKEYGLVAVEIGHACYHGKLHAFTESGLPILEETKIEKIPAHPPDGVNPFQHVQCGAVVKWDWSRYVSDGKGGIRFALLNRDAVSTARNVNSAQNLINGHCSVQPYLPNEYDIEINNLALLFMNELYHCVDDIEGNAKTFCFLLHDFKTWLSNNPNYRLKKYKVIEIIQTVNPKLSIEEAIVRENEEEIHDIYKSSIAKALFKKTEVTSWLHSYTQNSPPPISHPINAVQKLTGSALTASLSLPPIKNRVSTFGSGKAQVQNTCQENPEAIAYIEARKEQGATLRGIAEELKKAGGSFGVVGCLMKPECGDVEKARAYGKSLILKKAKP